MADKQLWRDALQESADALTSYVTVQIGGAMRVIRETWPTAVRVEFCSIPEDDLPEVWVYDSAGTSLTTPPDELLNSPQKFSAFPHDEVFRVISYLGNALDFGAEWANLTGQVADDPDYRDYPLYRVDDIDAALTRASTAAQNSGWRQPLTVRESWQVAHHLATQCIHARDLARAALDLPNAEVLRFRAVDAGTSVLASIHSAWDKRELWTAPDASPTGTIREIPRGMETLVTRLDHLMAWREIPGEPPPVSSSVNPVERMLRVLGIPSIGNSPQEKPRSTTQQPRSNQTQRPTPTTPYRPTRPYQQPGRGYER
jgi:hypothetical protein